MRGWFDAFRPEGGSTLYAYSNRTSVTGDVPTIVVCLIFLTLFLAFLAIFPGVRREKCATLCTVTLSLLVGTVICVCNIGSEWHVANGEVVSSYRAFSREKIRAHLGVSIGLNHLNVTMSAIHGLAGGVHSASSDINFNEEFHFAETADMRVDFQKALKKGLPYPILTVAEYLTLENEGFGWGRAYRTAGYYTNIILWSSFASWLLMNVLLVNVPRYGAYLMVLTGSLMGLSCLMFWTMIPLRPLEIHFENTVITFQFGWSFWLVGIAGGAITLAGIVISIADCIYPHQFSTILEVDFDTPYDRHIIIEESHDTRKRRFKIPRLDEPINAGLTMGSRLLHRLSKRTKVASEMSQMTNSTVVATGIDNTAFELDTAPSTPWGGSKRKYIIRTESKKSSRSVKSVNFHPATVVDISSHILDIPNILEIAMTPDANGEIDQPKPFVHSESKESNISFFNPSTPRKTSDGSTSSNFSSNHSGSNLSGSALMSRQETRSSCVTTSQRPGILSRQVSFVQTPPSDDNISRQSIDRSPKTSADESLQSRKFSDLSARSNRKISQESSQSVLSKSSNANIIVFHRTDSRGQLQRLAGDVIEIQTADDDSW